VICCLSSISSCLSTSMFPHAPACQSFPRTKVKMTFKEGAWFDTFWTWHGHRQSWHSSCHVADWNMHPFEKDEMRSTSPSFAVCLDWMLETRIRKALHMLILKRKMHLHEPL
jgi:hypothetical protein